MKKRIYWLIILILIFPMTGYAGESISTINEKSTYSTKQTESTLFTNAKASLVEKKIKIEPSLPQTGGKRTLYFSFAGIAITLLAMLFLFIKSKKGED